MNTARRLLAADSPSGFTQQAAAVVEQIAEELGYPVRRTNKGNVILSVRGRERGKTVGLCAHIDTLGLMVRSITADGMLMITKIGGPILPTLDGEYCRIYTRDGRMYTGTILSLSPAAHVFDDVLTRPRDEKNLAVRIDEPVRDKAGVEALGICAGDFVCFDPKTQVTGSGFLKSASSTIRAAPRACSRCSSSCGIREPPPGTTRSSASLYTRRSVTAVDMGCVGEDLNCTEYQVSICAKDNNGPYDYGMVSRLVELARANGVDYAVDIYPHYGSDVAAFWKAGNDTRGALIGPGVHASHGMERTHFDGMKHTIHLVWLYLECA